MNHTLQGNIALLTGSGRGIRRGAALKLAAHGARLVANDLDEEVAQQVGSEIRNAGGKALACPGNGAVYVLCLPESDYMSGQVLVCGGGYTP